MNSVDIKSTDFCWPKTQIARALNIHRNTVASVIERENIEPAKTTSSGDLFELHRIAAAYYGGQADEEKVVGWVTEDNIPIKTAKDRKDFFDSQKAELAFQEACGKFIILEEHIRDKREMLQAIINFFDNFPTRLEREGIATPEQADRLVELSDLLRNHLWEELQRFSKPSEER